MCQKWFSFVLQVFNFHTPVILNRTVNIFHSSKGFLITFIVCNKTYQTKIIVLVLPRCLKEINCWYYKLVTVFDVTNDKKDGSSACWSVCAWADKVGRDMFWGKWLKLIYEWNSVLLLWEDCREFLACCDLWTERAFGIDLQGKCHSVLWKLMLACFPFNGHGDGDAGASMFCQYCC